MERGLKAPLGPHEGGTFRRIALGISEATVLSARDVAYLIHLRLVDERDGSDLPPLAVSDIMGCPTMRPCQTPRMRPPLFRGATSCTGATASIARQGGRATFRASAMPDTSVEVSQRRSGWPSGSRGPRSCRFRRKLHHIGGASCVCA